MRNYLKLSICLTAAFLVLGFSWRSSAFAERKTVSMAVKESQYHELVAVARGKLVGADLTQSYEATVRIFENDTFLIEKTGTIDPDNPFLEDKTDFYHFRFEFIPDQDNPETGIVKVIFRLFYVKSDSEYKGEVRILQDWRIMLDGTATAMLMIELPD